MDKARNWLGPLSGIAFFVTFVIGSGIGGQIDSEPTDSASSVLAELRHDAGGIRMGAVFALLGVGFLLIFLAHLRAKFREGGAGWAADGFLIGGVVLAGGLIVFTAVRLAGAEAGDSGHTEVAQGVVDFVWNGTLIFSPGLLALGIAAAVASFTYRIMPTWLGVFSVLVALGTLAPWIGIFLFVVWVLAASIDELIRTIRQPATAADVE